MDVYWLEQSEADVPEDDDWLSESEIVRLNSLRFAKRRADWRLGRWTAKRALATCLNVPSRPQGFRDIELRPAPSGAPEVFLANEPVPVCISLSHRSGVAATAVALNSGALGCDLETVEPRSDTFVEDYFTASEQALVKQSSARDRPRLLALLWSAKESALKALRAGLRLDTRSVTVTLVDVLQCRGEDGGEHGEGRPLALPSLDAAQGWRPLIVRQREGSAFHGWWKNTTNLVRTVVATPPPPLPICLTMPAYSVPAFVETD